VWIVPAELTKALEGIGGALGGLIPSSAGPLAPMPPVDSEDTATLPPAPSAADMIAEMDKEQH
jgi:hypothetical protein